MKVVAEFTDGPRSCAYLADREATLSYVLVSELASEEYERFLNEGGRKFGALLFQPICRDCRACRPLRLEAATFKPSRNQKRALARNADLRVQFATPMVDKQRTDLYGSYHRAQAQRKGWPSSGAIQESDYHLQFLRNPIPAVEVTVWEGERLLALLLADVTQNVVSAIYHFHDPHEEKRSLGTFVILQAIALALKLNRRWVHLGYYVEGSASMAYKKSFKPAELLGEDEVWRSFQDNAAPLVTR